MIKTESAGGIVLNDNNVLVISQHGTSWSLPKGHIESGESKVDAAMREIKEESGIHNITLVRELGKYQRYRISKDSKEDVSELKTIYMFLFETKEKILKPIDPENPEAKWVPRNKVAELLTHPKDKEFFLSILNKI